MKIRFYRIHEDKVLYKTRTRNGFIAHLNVMDRLDKYPHNRNIGSDFIKSRVILSTNFKTFFKDRSSVSLMEIFPSVRDYMYKRG